MTAVPAHSGSDTNNLRRPSGQWGRQVGQQCFCIVALRNVMQACPLFVRHFSSLTSCRPPACGMKSTPAASKAHYNALLIYSQSGCRTSGRVGSRSGASTRCFSSHSLMTNHLSESATGARNSSRLASAVARSWGMVHGQGITEGRTNNEHPTGPPSSSAANICLRATSRFGQSKIFPLHWSSPGSGM